MWLSDLFVFLKTNISCYSMCAIPSLISHNYIQKRYLFFLGSSFLIADIFKMFVKLVFELWRVSCQLKAILSQINKLNNSVDVFLGTAPLFQTWDEYRDCSSNFLLKFWINFQQFSINQFIFVFWRWCFPVSEKIWPPDLLKIYFAVCTKNADSWFAQ